MKDLRFGTLVESAWRNSRKHVKRVNGDSEFSVQDVWGEIFYEAVLGEKVDIYLPSQGSGTFNKIIHCKAEPTYVLCRKSNKVSMAFLSKFMEKHVLENIEDIEKLRGEIVDLISAMPESIHKKTLLAIEDEISPSNYYTQMGKLLAECLTYSLSVTNKCTFADTDNEEENFVVLDGYKSFDLATDDPHGRSNPYSRSKAIDIEIQPELSGERPNDTELSGKVFHHFERCAEFIVRNDLVITAVECDLSKIVVKVKKTVDDTLVLRRIEKEDYDKVYRLIREANQEFRAKVSWQNRWLCDMALDGLESEKWLAYGYFNKNNEIIAYLDNKIRLDGDIELGIELVNPQYRLQGLAVSLIDLFRLKYPGNRIYAGTYEENRGMRAVFKKIGFVPNKFYDATLKMSSNRIKERYDPEHQRDEQYLTNSVYYVLDSIHFKVLERAERVPLK